MAKSAATPDRYPYAYLVDPKLEPGKHPPDMSHLRRRRRWSRWVLLSALVVVAFAAFATAYPDRTRVIAAPLAGSVTDVLRTAGLIGAD